MTNPGFTTGANNTMQHNSAVSRGRAQRESHNYSLSPHRQRDTEQQHTRGEGQTPSYSQTGETALTRETRHQQTREQTGGNYTTSNLSRFNGHSNE